MVSSAATFGNSWKTATCSDVTEEVFPCQGHSYCSAWAERRCMIIRNTFKECHGKVLQHIETLPIKHDIQPHNLTTKTVLHGNTRD